MINSTDKDYLKFGDEIILTINQVDQDMIKQGYIFSFGYSDNNIYSYM